jgi:hypothetical protein
MCLYFLLEYILIKEMHVKVLIFLKFNFKYINIRICTHAFKRICGLMVKMLPPFYNIMCSNNMSMQMCRCKHKYTHMYN